MPTLQDLMATIQGGQGRPGQGNLLAALAPLMGGGGGTGTGPLPGGLDSQIQDQIAALSQPEPTVDQPVPQQSKLWQRLIAGIADAGSVYAKGLNPYVPTTNTLGYLLGQDQAGKDITAGNIQRKKEAAYKGSQRGAELKLRQLLNEQQSKEQLAAEKVSAQFKQQEQQAKAAQDQAEFAAKLDLEKQQILSREKIAAMEQAGRAKSDALQVQLHQLRMNGESDKAQQDEYGKVRTYIVAMKRQYQQQLAQGQTTPDQIRQDLNDRLEATDLSGKYREAAQAFISAQIDPILMQYEYENQGPQAPSAPSQPLSITGQILGQHGP